MKKILLFTAFAVFALNVNAQEIKLGVSGSLPVGDADDTYIFGAQVDFSYLFEVNEAFKVGPMASLFYYKGDSYDYGLGSVDIDDAVFLPIGGSARFVVESFFFGADLGYGIGLSPDGNDGGFFYRPKTGYSFGMLGVVLSYSGVAVDGGTFSSINGGVEFTF